VNEFAGENEVIYRVFLQGEFGATVTLEGDLAVATVLIGKAAAGVAYPKPSPPPPPPIHFTVSKGIEGSIFPLGDDFIENENGFFNAIEEQFFAGIKKSTDGI
jgi:hypothetical protein